MLRSPFGSPVVVSLVLFLLGSRLNGEDVLDQLNPVEFDLEEPSRKKPEAKTSASEEILLESLRGLVIVSQESLAEARPAAGLQVVGFSPRVGGALAKLASQYLGRPASAESLRRLADGLSQWFEDHGQPLTEAYLPEQEVTDGVVTLAVRERRVGKVLLQGDMVFGRDYLLRQVRARPGQPLDIVHMRADLAWLNENPFRRVDLAIDPGDTDDVANLRLVASEQRPWRLYGGYNNHSNELLGDHQAILGATLGNLWGREHQLSMQALSSFDERLRAGAAVYTWPLPWRHLLEISGVVSRGDPALGSDLDLTGDQWRVGMKYRAPLATAFDAKQELFFGWEYQRNEYDFDASAADREVRFFTVNAGYSLRWGDSLGHSSVSAEAVVSPSWFGAEDEDYQALRGGADGAFWLARCRVERHWWLPGDSSLATIISGQFTDEPLLASHRYAATGHGETRGYDENAVLADRAVLCSIEWRSVPWETPLAKLLGEADALRAVVFWDYATFDNSGDLPEPNSLSAVGFGFRYQASHLSLRADLAFPLRSLEDHDDEPRLHLSAIWSF